MNFSSFKNSFTSNVNYLKRRYTSGDLSSECDSPPTSEKGEVEDVKQPEQPIVAPKPVESTPTHIINDKKPPTDLELNRAPSVVRGTSAPTSPSKTRESLLQRVQSLTGAAREQGASFIGAAVQSATRPSTVNPGKYVTLLVVDDFQTDWSKYFKGKRLFGDHDIRVEQAPFNELSVSSSNDTGSIVSMTVFRNGTKVSRSFKPDFILVRQPIKNGTINHSSIISGFLYGNVPSINSLRSLNSFQEKPWVFAHLLQLQRRLGKDAFVLVDQTFISNTNELMAWSKFPCVVKLSTCHGGIGMIRFDNQGTLLDYIGLISEPLSSPMYCTVEPYIDCKYDIHIQKIGTNYKSFMRKSISGNWKTNQGSAMLEQMPVTDKHKMWIDEISKTFGGLDICELSLLVDKHGRELIHRVKDSSFPLIGDSQEEDRRNIADLVSARMQDQNPAPSLPPAPTSVDTSNVGLPSRQMPIGAPPPPPIPERISPAIGSIGRLSSRSSISGDTTMEKSGNLSRRNSQTSNSETINTNIPEDSEDTMKNLRKTFAGIFGDM